MEKKISGVSLNTKLYPQETNDNLNGELADIVDDIHEITEIAENKSDYVNDFSEITVSNAPGAFSDGFEEVKFDMPDFTEKYDYGRVRNSHNIVVDTNGLSVNNLTTNHPQYVQQEYAQPMYSQSQYKDYSDDESDYRVEDVGLYMEPDTSSYEDTSYDT